ncbi:phage tail protein [Escherichia coli]|nr:phage tail protein [Escherichia coli]EFL9697347.1 phage tail protein [Escherichia coli]EGI4656387.1 phage tail protein [Escherichia coli]ELR5483948.1 phage tail protein [Escherichia coli]
MAINNFKPFALDPNANVTSQADWEALPALLSGFTAGKASSAQVNKAIRQASFIAAALAQYTANKSGLDVLDDGDLNGFISKMGTAFGKDFQALDATLSALAGLATGANKLPYFTGNDTAAQTDLTSVGRGIIGKNTIADILTYLGLGEAAKRNVGTGKNQIPDMSSYASGSGWRKMPDGSIEQWGRINFPNNAAAVSTNVTFTIPFTQEPDVVIVYDGGFGSGNMWGATNWTKTGFVAHCNYGFEGGAFYAKGR